MPPLLGKVLKWFVLAGILAGIHTALFVLVAIAVALSSDPEAPMGFYLFIELDYPLLRFYQLNLGPPVAMMPVLGGLLWFCYGFILQSLFSIHRIAGLLR